MAVTAKVSIAMGQQELRLAKTAAEKEGISLSAFVTDAVRARIADLDRREAALEVLATFDPKAFPSPEKQRQLLALWSTPPPPPKPLKKRKKAR